MTTRPLPEPPATAIPPKPRSGATPNGTSPAVAPRRLTGAALTGGVVVSAVCFLVAIAAEIAGNDLSLGDMSDVGALVEGLFAFEPWAWASLGVFALLLTPVVGLLTTAYEYNVVSDRRTVFLALAVLVVLSVSAVVAILR